MKIQDFGFIAILVLLLLLRRRNIFIIAGICCLVIAIPLYIKWIFFTAERLTEYAAAFFLCSLLIPKKGNSAVQ